MSQVISTWTIGVLQEDNNDVTIVVSSTSYPERVDVETFGPREQHGNRAESPLVRGLISALNKRGLDYRDDEDED